MIRIKYLVFFHSREFSKPLLPVGRAGVLLAEILHLLCKQMVSVALVDAARTCLCIKPTHFPQKDI